MGHPPLYPYVRDVTLDGVVDPDTAEHVVGVVDAASWTYGSALKSAEAAATELQDLKGAAKTVDAAVEGGAGASSAQGPGAGWKSGKAVRHVDAADEPQGGLDGTCDFKTTTGPIHRGNIAVDYLVHRSSSASSSSADSPATFKFDGIYSLAEADHTACAQANALVAGGAYPIVFDPAATAPHVVPFSPSFFPTPEQPLHERASSLPTSTAVFSDTSPLQPPVPTHLLVLPLHLTSPASRSDASPEASRVTLSQEVWDEYRDTEPLTQAEEDALVDELDTVMDARQGESRPSDAPQPLPPGVRGVVLFARETDYHALLPPWFTVVSHAVPVSGGTVVRCTRVGAVLAAWENAFGERAASAAVREVNAKRMAWAGQTSIKNFLQPVPVPPSAASPGTGTAVAPLATTSALVPVSLTRSAAVPPEAHLRLPALSRAEFLNQLQQQRSNGHLLQHLSLGSTATNDYSAIVSSPPRTTGPALTTYAAAYCQGSVSQLIQFLSARGVVFKDGDVGFLRSVPKELVSLGVFDNFDAPNPHFSLYCVPDTRTLLLLEQLCHLPLIASQLPPPPYPLATAVSAAYVSLKLFPDLGGTKPVPGSFNVGDSRPGRPAHLPGRISAWSIEVRDCRGVLAGSERLAKEGGVGGETAVTALRKRQQTTLRKARGEKTAADEGIQQRDEHDEEEEDEDETADEENEAHLDDLPVRKAGAGKKAPRMRKFERPLRRLLVEEWEDECAVLFEILPILQRTAAFSTSSLATDGTLPKPILLASSSTTSGARERALSLADKIWHIQTPKVFIEGLSRLLVLLGELPDEDLAATFPLEGLNSYEIHMVFAERDNGVFTDNILRGLARLYDVPILSLPRSRLLHARRQPQYRSSIISRDPQLLATYLRSAGHNIRYDPYWHLFDVASTSPPTSAVSKGDRALHRLLRTLGLRLPAPVQQTQVIPPPPSLTDPTTAQDYISDLADADWTLLPQQATMANFYEPLVDALGGKKAVVEAVGGRVFNERHMNKPCYVEGVDGRFLEYGGEVLAAHREPKRVFWAIGREGLAHYAGISTDDFDILMGGRMDYAVTGSQYGYRPWVFQPLTVNNAPSSPAAPHALPPQLPTAVDSTSSSASNAPGPSTSPTSHASTGTLPFIPHHLLPPLPPTPSGLALPPPAAGPSSFAGPSGSSSSAAGASSSGRPSRGKGKRDWTEFFAAEEDESDREEEEARKERKKRSAENAKKNLAGWYARGSQK